MVSRVRLSPTLKVTYRTLSAARLSSRIVTFAWCSPGFRSLKVNDTGTGEPAGSFTSVRSGGPLSTLTATSADATSAPTAWTLAVSVTGWPTGATVGRTSADRIDTFAG